MKISIAMPVYNGGAYFELALRSALEQTYDDIEIIVVNDGSTDGGATDAVARRYRDKIKYVTQANRGVAAALNTAIANMTGDAFTWLSHDDLFAPNKTAVQVDFHRRLRKEHAILCSDWTLIDEHGATIAEVTCDHGRLVRSPMLVLPMSYVNGCTLFIPRAMLERMGRFDERLRYTQDYDLWNQVLARYDFFHVPQRLVRYRVHRGQDSHKAGFVPEGNALWRKIMDARSELERVQMFGSSYRFYDHFVRHLENTRLVEARNHARRLADENILETTFSVIVPSCHDIDLVAKTVGSLLGQQTDRFEILVVGPHVHVAAALQGLDRRIRFLRESGSPEQALNAGLRHAAGSYIAFAAPDGRFFPTKLARQAEQMQKHGSVVSLASYLARDADGTKIVRARDVTDPSKRPKDAGLQPDIGALMIHRLAACEGFAFEASDDGVRDAVRRLAKRHAILAIDEPLGIAASVAPDGPSDRKAVPRTPYRGATAGEARP